MVYDQIFLCEEAGMVTPSVSILLLRTILSLPTPSFKMLLERFLNDPYSHHLTSSTSRCYPPPPPPPPPNKNFDRTHVKIIVQRLIRSKGFFWDYTQGAYVYGRAYSEREICVCRCKPFDVKSIMSGFRRFMDKPSRELYVSKTKN